MFCLILQTAVIFPADGTAILAYIREYGNEVSEAAVRQYSVNRTINNILSVIFFHITDVAEHKPIYCIHHAVNHGQYCHELQIRHDVSHEAALLKSVFCSLPTSVCFLPWIMS